MASEAPQLQPLQVLSLRDHIARQISSAILNGTYRPGDRLVESAVADQLGVSRAPVREALSALEQDGIVIQVPRRGYFIVDFTDKDIEEVYSLRMLLEVAALQRTIERVTEEDLSEMQNIVDALGQVALEKKDSEAIVGTDLLFHEFVCRLADHGRLLSAWTSLRMQTQLLVGVTSKTHYDDPDQPKEWHQRILDSIRNKELEQAQATLKEHLIDAKERAKRALQELRADQEGEAT